MTYRSSHLLIFTRYPVPGKVKTRLIPALGAEGAARIHRRMTEHVVGVVRATRKREAIGMALEITICYTGAQPRGFRAWLGTDLKYKPQHRGDIGARMHGAFEQAFRNGAEAVLAVGSDIPGITPEILHQALDGLRENHIVLGRAADGGYYLIGMKSLYPSLFQGMDWGTGRVYEQTRDAIRSLGRTFSDLPPLEDVDRPEDLARFQNDPRFMDLFSGKALVSVIIPTLDESTAIDRLLKHLHPSDTVQCIVADGGSRDDTREIATRAGASVLSVPGGRALQQNAGAGLAKGRYLLFLHADTLPPHGYADRIRATLAPPSRVAGAFQFKTDDSRPVMRLIERLTNLRSAIFQMPYGDQGIFLEKRIFDEMGGFRSMPVMEDFELMRRLHRRGTVVTLSDAAITSARRWHRLGLIRTTLLNQIMIFGFLTGISIQTLHRIYQRNSVAAMH